MHPNLPNNSNNSFPTRLPILKAMTGDLLEKMCCFALTIPKDFDVDDYEMDNSIISSTSETISTGFHNDSSPVLMYKHEYETPMREVVVEKRQMSPPTLDGVLSVIEETDDEIEEQKLVLSCTSTTASSRSMASEHTLISKPSPVWDDIDLGVDANVLPKLSKSAASQPLGSQSLHEPILRRVVWIPPCLDPARASIALRRVMSDSNRPLH